MNTNATIPTIDVESTALAIEWIDGANVEHRVAFDVPEHDNRAQLATDIFNCMRHVFFMGVDAIEPVVVDRSIERELREERDALRDSLNSDADSHLSEVQMYQARVADLERRLSDAQAGIVTIGDAGLADQVRKQMVELHRSGYSEGMGDVVSGPSWDDNDPRAIMYNIGRQARIGDAEAGTRIEALIGQVSTFQQDNSRLRHTVEEWERKHNGTMDEWAHVAAALLEEAEERGWCSEYEDFCSKVNDRTRTLKLTLREREYNVCVTVSQDPPYDEVDDAARRAGFGESYEASVADPARVDYQFTVTCRPDEIEAKSEALRRAIYNVSGISDASVEYSET